MTTCNSTALGLAIARFEQGNSTANMKSLVVRAEGYKKQIDDSSLDVSTIDPQVLLKLLELISSKTF